MAGIYCAHCGRLVPESDPFCVFCKTPHHTTEVAAETLPQPDVEDPLYGETIQLLRAPKRVQGRALLLIVSAVLFFAAQQSRGDSLLQVTILIGTLLFHEAGHYVAMRWFGYRDLRMFFIPYLGAAVSGVPRGVPAWQRGVVALAGPLPGILIGAVLLFVATTHGNPLLRQIAVTALALNGFNLLPVLPLDGGRLIQLVLASRSHRLESGFTVLAGIALIGLIIAMGGNLLWLGILICSGLAHHVAALRSARLLREEYPTLPEDPSALDDAQAHALFARARSATWGKEYPRKLAGMMELILSCTVPAPSMLARGGLVLLWGVGLGLPFGSFWGLGFQAGQHAKQAAALKEKGEFADAVQEAREAVRLAPTVGSLHLALGMALSDAQDFDAALQEYEEARKLDPHLAGVYNASGLAFDRKKDFTAAVREFTEFARLQPQSYVAHANLGFALAATGDLDGAIGQLQEAVQLDPKRASLHANLADALARKGESDEAMHAYHDALQLDPDHLQAHLGVARLLIGRGDSAGALVELRELLRLDPNLAEAHAALGTALRKQGETLAAIAEFNEALRLNPENAAVHSNLGVALQEMGRLQEAIAEYRESVKLAPSVAAAHANLGAALRATGERDPAIAEFREAQRLEPNAIHQRRLELALSEQSE